MATVRTKQRASQGKDSTDYLFFLVSFFAVIIFAAAPMILFVFAKLNPTNTAPLVSFENKFLTFGRVIVPLVIIGTVLRYLETRGARWILRLSTSTIVFFVAFMIELYFIWVYVYL